MSTTNNNRMPMATCPHCKTEFRHDDDCMTEVGEEITCPRCEGEMKVTGVDVQLTVTLESV